MVSKIRWRVAAVLVTASGMFPAAHAGEMSTSFAAATDGDFILAVMIWEDLVAMGDAQAQFIWV